MNDTFDNVTFSNITYLENVKETEKQNISFDDTFFINSQNLSILKSIENVKKDTSIIKTDTEDLFDPSFTENHNESDLFSESNSSIRESSDKAKAPITTTNKLKLSSWNLPEQILAKYQTRNITTMFQWQVDCLTNSVLKENKNLVYSAPTSAGKTLVAEILAIKTVLERAKKVIFILPFVSVVREKMFYFREILSSSGVRVEGFMGSYNPPGGFRSVQIAICTIEKANSLINHFLQDNSLKDIGAIIIDEMHLLGEPTRGYILELLLTKIRYICLKEGLKIQIIGMSATLPNLPTLSKWLDAELYITDFRPIPLYEHALVANCIYDSSFEQKRELASLPELSLDTDHILQLCLETLNENCSVLIFCPTKNWCENLALQISNAFFKLGKTQSRLSLELRQQIKSELIFELLEQLKGSPIGLDEVLRRTVSFGVAFHHAGLTLDERDIIEGAFRNGTIRVLVATVTLSSGVNLPAKRVIIRTPVFHGKPIDSLTYRQMIGRAGRLGRDTSGESILVCQKHEERFAKALMTQSLRPIESCLEGEGKLKRALLEIIASGVATTQSDIELFTQCTLLSQTQAFNDTIQDSLDFLIRNEFVRKSESNFSATNLGKACLASSIPPEDGLALFTELEKARQCFVLESELHLVYLVTPYSACHQWGNIDWMFYLNQWELLPASHKRVGELVGVKEHYLVSATRGKIQTNTSKSYHQLLIHKRFLVALALQDLVNEVSLSDVCNKFSCNRGMLQTLQLTAATFAGMVTAFSKQLGWSTVEILISQFQDRLHFGVSRDLLDLMRLPLLNRKSARALYNSGLETLISLANSDITTIESILHKAMPFESGKKREGESEFALKERQKLRNIWISGKEGLTEREAAELMLNSAREFLTIEMGLKEAKWGEEEQLDRSLFETTNLSLHSSTDLVPMSQDESGFDSRFFTPKAKKRKQSRMLLEETPKKKVKGDITMVTEFEMVDVCSNSELFETFSKEVKTQKRVSLAVACSQIQESRQLIGLTPSTNSNTKFRYKNYRVDGFGICWDTKTSYFLDLSKNEKCIDVIKALTQNDITLVIFDSKEQIKVLQRCCDINCDAIIEDPKIVDWLIESESSEKTFQAMVNLYCPSLSEISEICGVVKSRGSPSLDLGTKLDPKSKSCIESFLSWQLIGGTKSALFKQNPKFETIFKTEMSCIKVLARMELNGVRIDKLTLDRLIQTLEERQSALEKKAFALCGRRFSFSSTKTVAKILGLRGSTKKQILEKVANPVSELILQWRKINCTITKMIEPLIRACDDGRIYGSCIVHTATGRISMHEPNLQNVAKNFDVEGVRISCREAFVAGNGNVLVSADYCQLELRLLAHLCQDEDLVRILRKEGDVFRAVAAKWNKLDEEEVSDSLRQSAKQICYGIIYGMGSRALSEQLNIGESQAADFMTAFKNSYPGIKKYIQNVIEKCEKNGFVETILGRRRYLPQITNTDGVLKSQAERQAVNTTVQGSAADLMKKTMICLGQKFHNKYPKLVLHLHDELIYEIPNKKLKEFSAILKRYMEECVNLTVPFPVKMKTGTSWGQMTEIV